MAQRYAREFNIVNNLYAENKAGSFHGTTQHSRTVLASNKRDYHMISNRYYSNHEDRVKTDKNASLDKSLEIYKKTRRFDPLKGKYNDPVDEKSNHILERHLEKLAVATKLDRQPHHMHFNQTVGADILSNNIKDQRIIKLHEHAVKRAKMPWNVGHCVQEDQTHFNLVKSGFEQLRVHNRQKPEIRHKCHPNLISNTDGGI